MALPATSDSTGSAACPLKCFPVASTRSLSSHPPDVHSVHVCPTSHWPIDDRFFLNRSAQHEAGKVLGVFGTTQKNMLRISPGVSCGEGQACTRHFQKFLHHAHMANHPPSRADVDIAGASTSAGRGYSGGRCPVCFRNKKGRCGTATSSLKCEKRRAAGLPYLDPGEGRVGLVCTPSGEPGWLGVIDQPG